ncbi:MULTISPECIES: phospho-sugar mutase [Oceanobacillus]|uniref:Phosphoglucomutase n=1 Tax=Oceanobacillus indicireducens TaxID=1004261 RepID=A0A918CZ49_9BACI|nr:MULTISPECIES: phospho-sugar mutase [Oceanobacillus]GGN50436.1 phosphomannomutase [Oceanobacillus indicireducens]
MAKNWEQTFEKWLAFENLDSNLQAELKDLKNDPKETEDAFYQELTFGTGGIRGVLGPGTNRMNIYTVRKAVNGLANYLLEHVVNAKQRGVAIAYDSRYMSQEFAVEAAKVLGAYGIRASVFTSIRPTPVLSYAVRYLNAAAGIMITASHNPPQYNGLKVYNEQGGQILLEEAEQITAAIQATGDELQVPVRDKKELEDELLLYWLGEEVDRSYLENLIGMTKMGQEELEREKDLKIIYTPLHGTGTDLVARGFKQLNFPNVTIVEEQAVADPEFSTVESPNPEEHQAFKLAIQYGEKENADVLLATDPDADRLGAAVKNKAGEYVVLTGNQLGSLLLDYILSHSNLNVYRNARMIKTVVTTELGRAIADSYGVETIETLTGFKYIAEKIAGFDSTGETFMFGYEESYGYLASGFTRDKDAVQAAMLTAEMAHYWKSQGKSVLEALHSLYEKHGYYLEGLNSLTLEGKEGSEQIAKIMEEIRHRPMEEVAGIRVEKVENYVTSERTDTATGTTETINLPQENMMKFILEEDGWVCFRPSGTEPKLKYYYGVRDKSEEASTKKLEMIQIALDEILAEIIKK